MAYGIKYQFSIESVNGDDVDIYLLQRNYSGQRYIRSLGRAPILKRERNDCILGTSLEIFAECRVDGEFAELYTSDAYEYKVEVYKRQILQWTGFVSPELYAEPDIAPPYDVQIIATDGLGELKNYDFEASTRKSIMTHIRSLLQHTGLNLSYKVISDLQFDDDGGRVDAEEAFIGAVVDIDNLVGESSYDVLQKLLRSIGACITQQEGRWYLIRESDLYYRLEDINAAEFGSMNSCDWWPVGNLNADIMPAKNKIVITQKNSYKDNILPAVAEGINGGWSLLGGVYYDRDEACNILPNEQSSMAYTLISAVYPLRQPLMLTIKARCLTDIDGVINSRIGIKVAAKGGVSSINASEFYLIYGKPAGYERYIPIWTAQSSGLGSSIVHSWEPPVVQFGDPDIEEIDIQIPLSDAGNGYYAYAYAEELEITVFNPSSDYPICVYECSLTQCHRPSGLELTANIGNNAREVYGDTEVMLASGDASLAVTMYGILVADGGITKWYSGNNSAESLLQLLALDIARQVALPRMRYRGKLNVPSMAVPEVPLLFFRDGTYYFLNTYSYDLLNDEVEVELISIPNAAVIIESESITELSPTTGGGSGNSGVAGGGDNDPGIIVDSVMSDESTNPVGNRVIKAYVDSETKKAQAAAEQYIQDEVLTDYATTEYVEEREEYLVGYTEKWVTNLEKDIKANPSSFITLKTINNQSLFGSGNLEVKTTVDANDIRNAVFTGTGSQFLKGDGSLDSNAYLPLTGGTIESAGIPLTIKRTNNPYSIISFYGIADGISQHFGYLGFSGVGEPIYMTRNESERILIHSGNVGSYALKTDGSNRMSAGVKFNLNPIDFNEAGDGVLMLGEATANGATKYSRSLSVIEGSAGFQLSLPNAIYTNFLFTRKKIDNVWSDWEQIAFVSDLGNYLPLSGGILSDSWSGGTEVRRKDATNGYASLIFSQADGTILGRFGFGGVDMPLFVTQSGAYNPLLHSGNVGYYSVKRSDAIDLSQKSLSAVGYGTTTSGWLIYGPAIAIGHPNGYAMLLQQRTDNNKIYVNRKNPDGIAGDWQQLAFTDSTVEAAKRIVNDNGDYVIYRSGSGNIIVGDNNGAGDTHLLGNNIYLRYGGSAAYGLTLNSNGNVLIGTTEDVGYKLDVKGSSHLHSYEGATYVHIGPAPYGTKILVRDNGNTYFQSQRFDSITAYYNLVLQELGGNVSIGNTKIDSGAKLQVATTFRDTLPSLGSLGSGSDFAIQYTSTYACFGLYFSLDAQLGNTTIQTGRSDGGAATYALLLNPLGGNVGIGTSDPAYKLDVNGIAYATSGLYASSVSINRHPSTGGILNTSLSALKIEAYASDVRVNVYKPTAAAATALTLFNNGSLGVGTTSYNNYLLDVAGTGRFTGLASFDAGVKIGDATLTWGTKDISISKPIVVNTSVTSPLLASTGSIFAATYIKAQTYVEAPHLEVGNTIMLNGKQIGSWDEIGGGGDITIVEQTTTSGSVAINPNVINRWGTLISGNNITISFQGAVAGVANYYMIEFAVGSSAPTITLPSNVVWMNSYDILANLLPNTKYQISVMNNLAVGGAFN